METVAALEIWEAIVMACAAGGFSREEDEAGCAVASALERTSTISNRGRSRYHEKLEQTLIHRHRETSVTTALIFGVSERCLLAANPIVSERYHKTREKQDYFCSECALTTSHSLNPSHSIRITPVCLPSETFVK